MVLEEEEERFDNALRKIGQVTDASDNLNDLTKKLGVFEIAASRQESRVEIGVSSSQLEAHMASHEMGSSPEKARPGKCQRYSRRTLSVGPSETLSDLLRPEPLPGGILDLFTSTRPQPDLIAPSNPQPTTHSAMKVQSTSPETLNHQIKLLDQPRLVQGQIQGFLQILPTLSEESRAKSRSLATGKDKSRRYCWRKFLKYKKGKELYWRPDGAVNRGGKRNMEGEK